mmetsp:Transcript_21993/g.48037  ORF Transcript_21993/g.48037 Transcript_21993/m.48037 type:complete len:89 (-) Transcript_21993:909-1175(-)
MCKRFTNLSAIAAGTTFTSSKAISSSQPWDHGSSVPGDRGVRLPVLHPKGPDFRAVSGVAMDVRLALVEAVFGVLINQLRRGLCESGP